MTAAKLSNRYQLDFDLCQIRCDCVYNSRTKKGYFADFNYTQDKVYMDMTSIQSKTYGYLLGEARPDFYLYYNQDLIDNYNLPDPATLWNQGKWDWTAFTTLLSLAKTKLPEGSYAMGGVAADVIQGLVAARGGKFVDRGLKNVLLSSPTVEKLSKIYKKFINYTGIKNNYTAMLAETLFRVRRYLLPVRYGT